MMQAMSRASPSDAAADPLRLARLVGLRLCHDLGGVAGTVGNALEMMEGAGDEAAALAIEAAEVLRRRLTLWRALLGGQGDATLGALLGLLQGQLAGGRASAECTLDPAQPVAEAAVPVLLAAALVGGEALPRGGVVRLAGDPRREITIWPDGPRAAWPPALLRALSGAPLPPETMGREVLPVWLSLTAATAGARIGLAMPPGEGVGPMMVRFGAYDA